MNDKGSPSGSRDVQQTFETLPPSLLCDMARSRQSAKKSTGAHAVIVPLSRPSRLRGSAAVRRPLSVLTTPAVSTQLVSNQCDLVRVVGSSH